MRVSGDHLLTLFNHVLDYSRLEAGRMPLEQVPFAVLDVVEEALEMVALPALTEPLPGNAPPAKAGAVTSDANTSDVVASKRDRIRRNVRCDS